MIDTYQEPLAKVVRRPGIDGIDLYLVSCNGAPVDLVSGDPVSAYIDAELINDAVWAREKALRDRIAELEKELREAKGK